MSWLLGGNVVLRQSLPIIHPHFLRLKKETVHKRPYLADLGTIIPVLRLRKKVIVPKWLYFSNLCTKLIGLHTLRHKQLYLNGLLLSLIYVQKRLLLCLRTWEIVPKKLLFAHLCTNAYQRQVVTILFCFANQFFIPAYRLKITK